MRKKKVLSGVIAATTLCSALLPVSAFATTESASENVVYTQSSVKKVKHDNVEYTYQILQDDENIRKVKVTAKDGTSVVSYDKNTGDFDVIDSKGKATKLKSDKQARTSAKQNLTNGLITTQGVTYKVIYSQREAAWGSECEVTKYTYTYPSSTKYVWYIASSDDDGTSVEETSSNSSDLGSFKSSVSTTKSKQLEAAAALGAGYSAMIAALITAPPSAGMSTVLGILAAAGCTGTAAVLLWQSYDAHQDAIYYYNRLT